MEFCDLIPFHDKRRRAVLYAALPFSGNPHSTESCIPTSYTQSFQKLWGRLCSFNPAALLFFVRWR